MPIVSDMDEPTFDIFRGSDEKNGVWVESVAGLSQARRRMVEIAITYPGEYFVSNSSSHCILARVDIVKVSPPQRSTPPRKAEIA
jgi:hypothetical protein